MLFVNPTLFVEGLEQRNDISVIEPPSLAQTEQITSKIWLITSDEFGCSSKNQKAMEWLQSISFVYFSLYGIKSEFDTLQCLHINQIENDPDNFLFSLQNYDLPILVFDSEPPSHMFSKENSHHYHIIGYKKPHIVFCYCAIPAISHTATWELSHQLSHFILNVYGENNTISQDWVHDVVSESVKCVNIRRQPGLCSDKWTPIFGNFPKEMMTVKIHPDYFHELDSIQQLLLSQEQNKKNKSETIFRNVNYDLIPNVQVNIVDLKIVSINDKSKYPLDDSDVLVITFEITNNGIHHFILNDKMFKILVLDPSFPVGKGKPESRYLIDNYYALQDKELETKYNDYSNLKIFEDCDYLHDRIFENQTKTYSICFDILRKSNNEVLNIDGLKYYFLVLMDNIQFNSCPNCVENLLSSEMMDPNNKKILLPSGLHGMVDQNDIQNLPSWFQKITEWHKQGIISESELINAINYLNGNFFG
jgi:hypothetical protein